MKRQVIMFSRHLRFKTIVITDKIVHHPDLVLHYISAPFIAIATGHDMEGQQCEM